MNNKYSIVRLLAVVCGFVLSGCEDSPSESLPRDTTPPAIAIQSVGTGDSDGDGFVDFTISWRGQHDVDVQKTTIREISAAPERAVINLFDHWAVSRTDSSIHIVERVPHILGGGNARVEIAIRDTAGNARLDTLEFELPHAKLIKTISTGRQANFVMHAVDIAICGDGLGYMPAGMNMVIFDPDSLKLVADVSDPEAFDAHLNLTCDRDDSTIYVTGDFKPFDMKSRSWQRFLPGMFAANAVRSSPSRPEIIYIGERDGAVVTFDRRTRRRIGRISPPSSSPEDPIFGMTVMPDDSKVYATRAVEGGVVVIDPQTRTIVKRIAVGTGSAGVSSDVDLGPAAQNLYVAVQDGAQRGVAIVDTKSDEVRAFIRLLNAVPAKLAVSPSGERLFVTTFDQWDNVSSDNFLIDLASRRILQTFPRPRVGGRWDAQIVFHPHGKYFFVARNMDVDVYLNREN